MGRIRRGKPSRAKFRPHKRYYDRTIDFHGAKLLDAEIDIHLTIGAARAAQEPEIVRFVTGHGAIKEMLMNILDEYDIGYAEQLGNTGAILAVVE